MFSSTYASSLRQNWSHIFSQVIFMTKSFVTCLTYADIRSLSLHAPWIPCGTMNTGMFRNTVRVHDLLNHIFFDYRLEPVFFFTPKFFRCYKFMNFVNRPYNQSIPNCPRNRFYLSDCYLSLYFLTLPSACFGWSSSSVDIDVDLKAGKIIRQVSKVPD